jgi:hypothetical protein
MLVMAMVKSMSRLAWLAAASAVACAPEDWREIPPITWVGEHLEYAPQEGADEPCAGTLPYMDRYLELVAEAMGVELDERVVFVQGSDEAETLCDNEQAYGCSFAQGVYARASPQEHELVHGVRWVTHGPSHSFFEEGTAEVFGDDMHAPSRAEAHGDLIEGINSGGGNRRIPIEWYPRAGHFAAFLHDQYGPDVTTALLQQTNGRSTTARTIEAIVETTGVPWEEVREDYEREPTCSQSQYRYPLAACAQPVALRARCDETVKLVQTLDCDDPGTLGPRDEGIWTYLLLEVEQDGEYEVTAFHPVHNYSALELKECALGCGSILHDQLYGFDTLGTPLHLHAGRYALKLLRPNGDSSELEVKVEGLGCS